MWGYHRSYWVKPEDLIAFAWSAPMRELAAKVGKSDTGLKKYLRSLGVVPPPQGYWNRLRAGKPVPSPPAPEPRKPGGRGRVRVIEWLEPFIPAAEQMPSSGPFASKLVPGSLDELRARELKAVGRVSVPRTLEAAHKGLRYLLGQEERRRQRSLRYQWGSYDETLFSNPVDQRRLRLLNGLFLVLARRGHDGDLYERDRELFPSVTIGDTGLNLSLSIAGKHPKVMRSARMVPDPALPASTPLLLSVEEQSGKSVLASWQDQPGQRLESRIGEIAAELIVAGEAKLRSALRQEEEEAERKRIEDEKRREQERLDRERRLRERREAANQKRIDDLLRSGELLRQSREIRALVAELRTRLPTSDSVITSELLAWEEWALAQADRLDPILSGQILDHIRPPAIDENDGGERQVR